MKNAKVSHAVDLFGKVYKLRSKADTIEKELNRFVAGDLSDADMIEYLKLTDEIMK